MWKISIDLNKDHIYFHHRPRILWLITTPSLRSREARRENNIDGSATACAWEPRMCFNSKRITFTCPRYLTHFICIIQGRVLHDKIWDARFFRVLFSLRPQPYRLSIRSNLIETFPDCRNAPASYRTCILQRFENSCIINVSSFFWKIEVINIRYIRFLSLRSEKNSQKVALSYIIKCCFLENIFPIYSYITIVSIFSFR